MFDVLISAAPLTLAGTGALWTELAGSLAIALEGWMALGAFAGYCWTLWTGSSFLGAALAALSASAAALLLAIFVEKTGADPFIAGLASNLGIAGAIPLISAKIFAAAGVLRLPSPAGGALLPSAAFARPPAGASHFGDWHLGSVCAALVFAALSAYLLNKTPLGLRLRSSGLAPAAAAERGVNPARYRVLSWTVAAFLAALGGAALTFRVGVYAPGGVAGRGWLALAAVFLGFRKTRGVLAASLVFAAAGRLALRAQNAPSIPAPALLGLPSLIALALYALSLALSKNKLIKEGIK